MRDFKLIVTVLFVGSLHICKKRATFSSPWNFIIRQRIYWNMKKKEKKIMRSLHNVFPLKSSPRPPCTLKGHAKTITFFSRADLKTNGLSSSSPRRTKANVYDYADGRRIKECRARRKIIMKEIFEYRGILAEGTSKREKERESLRERETEIKGFQARSFST